MSTDTSNSTIALDKNKANQPSANPFFRRILKAYKLRNMDPRDFTALVQESLTFEKAKAHLSYRTHFKPTYHSKLAKVSRETFYTWIEKYTKGGEKS